MKDSKLNICSFIDLTSHRYNNFSSLIKNNNIAANNNSNNNTNNNSQSNFFNYMNNCKSINNTFYNNTNITNNNTSNNINNSKFVFNKNINLSPLNNNNSRSFRVSNLTTYNNTHSTMLKNCNNTTTNKENISIKNKGEFHDNNKEKKKDLIKYLNNKSYYNHTNITSSSYETNINKFNNNNNTELLPNISSRSNNYINSNGDNKEKVINLIRYFNHKNNKNSREANTSIKNSFINSSIITQEEKFDAKRSSIKLNKNDIINNLKNLNNKTKINKKKNSKIKDKPVNQKNTNSYINNNILTEYSSHISIFSRNKENDSSESKKVIQNNFNDENNNDEKLLISQEQQYTKNTSNCDTIMYDNKRMFQLLSENNNINANNHKNINIKNKNSIKDNKIINNVNTNCYEYNIFKNIEVDLLKARKLEIINLKNNNMKDKNKNFRANNSNVCNITKLSHFGKDYKKKRDSANMNMLAINNFKNSIDEIKNKRFQSDINNTSNNIINIVDVKDLIINLINNSNNNNNGDNDSSGITKKLINNIKQVINQYKAIKSKTNSKNNSKNISKINSYNNSIKHSRYNSIDGLNIANANSTNNNIIEYNNVSRNNLISVIENSNSKTKSKVSKNSIFNNITHSYESMFKGKTNNEVDSKCNNREMKSKDNICLKDMAENGNNFISNKILNRLNNTNKSRLISNESILDNKDNNTRNDYISDKTDIKEIGLKRSIEYNKDDINEAIKTNYNEVKRPLLKDKNNNISPNITDIHDVIDKDNNLDDDNLRIINLQKRSSININNKIQHKSNASIGSSITDLLVLPNFKSSKNKKVVEQNESNKSYRAHINFKNYSNNIDENKDNDDRENKRTENDQESSINLSLKHYNFNNSNNALLNKNYMARKDCNRNYDSDDKINNKETTNKNLPTNLNNINNDNDHYVISPVKSNIRITNNNTKAIKNNNLEADSTVAKTFNNSLCNNKKVGFNFKDSYKSNNTNSNNSNNKILSSVDANKQIINTKNLNNNTINNNNSRSIIDTFNETSSNSKAKLVFYSNKSSKKEVKSSKKKSISKNSLKLKNTNKNSILKEKSNTIPDKTDKVVDVIDDINFNKNNDGIDSNVDFAFSLNRNYKKHNSTIINQSSNLHSFKQLSYNFNNTSTNKDLNSKSNTNKDIDSDDIFSKMRKISSKKNSFTTTSSLINNNNNSTNNYFNNENLSNQILNNNINSLFNINKAIKEKDERSDFSDNSEQSISSNKFNISTASKKSSELKSGNLKKYNSKDFNSNKSKNNSLINSTKNLININNNKTPNNNTSKSVMEVYLEREKEQKLHYDNLIKSQAIINTLNINNIVEAINTSKKQSTKDVFSLSNTIISNNNNISNTITSAINALNNNNKNTSNSKKNFLLSFEKEELLNPEKFRKMQRRLTSQNQMKNIMSKKAKEELSEGDLKMKERYLQYDSTVNALKTFLFDDDSKENKKLKRIRKTSISNIGAVENISNISDKMGFINRKIHDNNIDNNDNSDNNGEFLGKSGKNYNRDKSNSLSPNRINYLKNNLAKLNPLISYKKRNENDKDSIFNFKSEEQSQFIMNPSNPNTIHQSNYNSITDKERLNSPNKIKRLTNRTDNANNKNREKKENSLDSSYSSELINKMNKKTRENINNIDEYSDNQDSSSSTYSLPIDIKLRMKKELEEFKEMQNLEFSINSNLNKIKNLNNLPKSSISEYLDFLKQLKIIEFENSNDVDNNNAIDDIIFKHIKILEFQARNSNENEIDYKDLEKRLALYLDEMHRFRMHNKQKSNVPRIIDLSEINNLKLNKSMCNFYNKENNEKGGVIGNL